MNSSDTAFAMTSPPDDTGASTGPEGPHGLDLARVNAMTAEDFVEALGGAVEHAPWVARRVWPARPFGSSAALANAMRAAIRAAAPDEQRALLRGHPELAGQEARHGQMTPESTGEQGRLGLTCLPAAVVRRIEALNCGYRERFGYPLVIALRLHDDLDSVLAEGERRLTHGAAGELAVAIDQVCEVMTGRVHRLFGSPGTPAT